MIGREPTALEVLEEYGHVLVKTVAAGDHGDAAQNALIDVAYPAGDYSPGDWDKCLAALDRCNLKVSTWLAKQPKEQPS